MEISVWSKKKMMKRMMMRRKVEEEKEEGDRIKKGKSLVHMIKDQNSRISRKLIFILG